MPLWSLADMTKATERAVTSKILRTKHAASF